MNDFFKVVKTVFFSPAFAGVVGAVLAIIWHKPDLAMVAFYLISGFFAAMYGAEPIVKWQGVDDGWITIVAMIIGVFAGTLIGMILKFIRDGALARIIEDFFSKGKRRRDHHDEE